MLDGCDVAVFVETELREQVAKNIGAGVWHRVGGEPYHQVRVVDLPGVRGRELGRGRRVGRLGGRATREH